MNSPSDERQLGDYRLKELLQESNVSRTWLAEQLSVSRMVLVDEHVEGGSEGRDQFMADVRAKAAVDHPLIGSVYEAVATGEVCFFAHELLPGATLAAVVESRETLLPARAAHILRRIAEANVQYEATGLATSPLTLDAVHVDDHGVIRLKNLVVAGARWSGLSIGDIVRLGNELPPLVGLGHPGSTRLLTVLGWMRGEGVAEPISWEQVRDFCLQIEHQLADPLSIVAGTKRGQATRKKQPMTLVLVATVAALAVIAVLALKTRPPKPTVQRRAPLPEPVLVEKGTYPTPDGMEEALPAFRISANEITIGQYSEFLEALATLAKDKRERTFDMQDQPGGKTGHEPDDWSAMLAAAKSGGLWKNLPVTLDTPVVGVDWWDASAYAEWKKSRLPTQEEWFAALTKDVKVPAALAPSPWMPVTDPSTDRTPGGLLGMAGSVCEWMAQPSANPANPLGEKLWVLAGGSHLKPGSNALTREWTGNRALRRPDLGFRIVTPAD